MSNKKNKKIRDIICMNSSEGIPISTYNPQRGKRNDFKCQYKYVDKKFIITGNNSQGMLFQIGNLFWFNLNSFLSTSLTDIPISRINKNKVHILLMFNKKGSNNRVIISQCNIMLSIYGRTKWDKTKCMPWLDSHEKICRLSERRIMGIGGSFHTLVNPPFFLVLLHRITAHW